MQLTAIACFWISLAGILYAYVGYPLLLAGLSRWTGFLRRDQSAQDIDQSFSELSIESFPELTVLIAAHNAASYLPERIRNILSSDYPTDKIRIVVASDGSTDKTVSVVQSLAYKQVSVVEYAERRGKVATLSDAITTIADGVVVMTDASTRFEPTALRRLASHFADRSIGLVAGQPVMVDAEGRRAESIYWRLEMKMRQQEAQLGILLGASGAIYAFRRELFVQPTRPLMHDDLVIPTLIVGTHRCRFVMDPNALALVSSAGGIVSEFRRRVRIGSGVIGSLVALTPILKRANVGVIAALSSRKIMRWLCPFLMISLALSNAALTEVSFYKLFGALQGLGYTVALLGMMLPRNGLTMRFAGAASSFLLMNAALLLGIGRSLLRPGDVQWTPTRRPTWAQLASVTTANHSGTVTIAGQRATIADSPNRVLRPTAQPSLKRA